MMEEFVDSEVLEAVRQRIAMVKIKRTAKVEELQGDVREAKKWDREEKEEEKARAAHQKTEGGKQITVYDNTRTIGLDRKLGPIKLDVNSRDSILQVKSKLESVVGLTTHEMIISNASDEDMSDEKSLAMCKVAMGSFIIIKRRSWRLLSVHEGTIGINARSFIFWNVYLSLLTRFHFSRQQSPCLGMFIRLPICLE